MALQPQGEYNATTIVRGLAIHFNEKIIIRVTTLALGVRCGKEDRTKSIIAKTNFFLLEEKEIEDKNGLEGKACLTHGMKQPTTSLNTYLANEGLVLFIPVSLGYFMS